MSNCTCNPTEKTAETLTAVAIGKPLSEQNRIQLPESLLQNYVGTYLMGGEEWTVSIKENELYFQFPNGNGHPIYPVSENEFYAEEWDSKFRFRETNGNVEFHFIHLGETVKDKRIVAEYNKTHKQ